MIVFDLLSVSSNLDESAFVKIGVRQMSKPKGNYFIIETYDEEKDMRVQFHYWTAGKHFYLSTELEDGTTVRKCRVSEKEYMDALETYHDMQK